MGQEDSGADGNRKVVWNSSLRRRVVAAWLALGGGWGFTGTIWTMSSLEVGPDAHAALRVPVVGLIPFTVVAAAGVLLWLGTRLGQFVAALSICLQIVSFRIGDVEYLFSVGVGLFAGVDGPDLAFNASVGSRFVAALTPQPEPFLVLINVIPLVALALLLAPPLSNEAAS
jgi:hypothetical protein